MPPARARRFAPRAIGPLRPVAVRTIMGGPDDRSPFEPNRGIRKMSDTIPILGGLMAAAAVAMMAVSGERAEAGAAGAAGPQLAHMVFFKLKDDSGGARAKLVAACKLLLTGHEGTVYFAAGTLAGDLKREVNDRDFDVSLHIVFASKEAHDKYQDHPRHLKFVEENKGNWAKVRVFDSYVLPVAAPADH
jgi:hypothetical protein